MSDWSIRLAQPEDAAAMHAVEEGAATLLHEEPSLAGIPVPPSTTAEDYRATIAKGHCLVAISGDELVGFAAAGRIGRELHLHELSVARARQGQGIGAILLRALAIDARNCGCRAITLNTYRDIPWNGPFYARQGYVELGDFAGRPHLAQSHDAAIALGLPAARRCAMIKFLD